MENVLENNLYNNIGTNLKEIVNEKTQNNFLQTDIGKVVNFALDIGIRKILPDSIENEIIDIKNTIINEGFSEGLNKAVDVAINVGKSVVGIFSGNFENINQVEIAIKKGGVLEGLSNVIDFTLDKIEKKGVLPEGICNIIKNGKDFIMENISSNLEKRFNEQLKGIDKISEHFLNWNKYYIKGDLSSMEKTCNKINKELENIIPLENIIKEAREIENITSLIKNNGGNFELAEEQIELAKIL